MGTSNERTLRGRGAWLRALLIFGLILAARAGAATLPGLTFGFTPVLGQAEIRAEFTPVAQYLSGALGRPVALRVAPHYDDLRREMEAGEVDIGSFSPFAYVVAARDGRVRIIAQSLIFGAAAYRGLIIVRKDSGLESLAQLAGKRFDYVDRTSASGYVYPRALLIERGFPPDAFFASTRFTGNHEMVIREVLNRRADAGAIYDAALEVARRDGVDTAPLEILARTEPIPHDAIAVRAGLEPALVRQITRALVDFQNTAEGRRIIAASKKGLTGFQRADDGIYSSVRRTAEVAGL